MATSHSRPCSKTPSMSSLMVCINDYIIINCSIDDVTVIFQATQSSSMESLESSMSTSETTAGKVGHVLIMSQLERWMPHMLILIVCVFSEAESARLATVLQENAVLKSELEILKLKCRNLHEENRRLRQASVNIVSPHSIPLPFFHSLSLFLASSSRTRRRIYI